MHNLQNPSTATKQNTSEPKSKFEFYTRKATIVKITMNRKEKEQKQERTFGTGS